jgi:D-alanyl-D-alanine carboxypeptidase/D-alanyl-D-alanine-endopeptidase (penicillin-binding protein 4)
MLRTIISLLLAGIFLSGQAQTTVPDSVGLFLRSWQTSSALVHASIGVAVSDLTTGEILFKSEPQLSLVPASVLKTVTTATALEVFGPDYRFTTTLSYSGTIKNDTLFGDLQVVGGGDPTLGSEYFPEQEPFLKKWAEAVQNLKIRNIQGSLILDARIYEQQMIPNTWIWEDMGNYYGAGACGLTVFDNLYEIHLKSPATAGKPTKIIRISPEIPNLDLQNEVLSSEINSDQAYVFGSPLDSRRILRGTIPKNQTDFVVKASVPDPPALLASMFRKELAASRISISGETKFERAVKGETIVETKSPPLSEIISVTNHESVNLFAEHFLKHLAWKANGTGTTKNGCKFVEQFWKEKGLDLSGFFMNDGSGLSRFNAVTAGQLLNVLNYMHNRSKYSSFFEASLPTAGNGTLYMFNDKEFPDDCLYAKSGSMTRVRCYAGYLTTISGRQLSFVFMLNNFSCTQTEAIRKIKDALLKLRQI